MLVLIAYVTAGVNAQGKCAKCTLFEFSGVRAHFLT
jgi:hypothetical protein